MDDAMISSTDSDSSLYRTVYSAESGKGIESVLRDLREGFARRAVWMTFAWDEVQQRYQRSVLGILWIVLSYLIFVVAITVFFRGFATLATGTFLAYAAFGFAAFSFLTSNLIDGCTVFTQSSAWIKSASLPYSVYVYKSLARAIFTFAIQFFSALLLMLALGWRPTLTSLLVLPALLAFFVNAVWVQYLTGLFSARWGDVRHLVATLQRLLFFTTPILWVYEERSGTLQRIADVNPFTHFVEIFRAPLLGDYPNDHSVILVCLMTIIGWIATLFIASRMKRRLPFWI